MRRLVCTALVAILTIVGSEVEGQQAPASEAQVLQLHLSGRPSDETLAILRELLEQSALERVVAEDPGAALSADQLCRGTTCDLSASMDPAFPSSGNQRWALPFAWGGDSRTFRYVESDEGRFVLVDSDDPLVQPIRWKFGPETRALAVPIDDEVWQTALASGSVPTLMTSPGGVIRFDPTNKLDAVLSDLDRLGDSDRQLRINSQLDPETRAELIDRLAQDPNVAEALPQTEFEERVKLVAPEFEMAGSGCDAPKANWPFDVDGMVRILDFDKRVLEQVGGWPPRRSRILILDSGVHRDLLDLPAIAPLLYLNVPERMSAQTARVSDIAWPDVSMNSKCLDFDGDGQPADYYGGSPEAGSSCLRTGFALERLNPIEKKPGATQSYYPEHGSVVAVLAAGGPDLMLRWPDLQRLIGLSFYRITTASPDPCLSVEIQPTDITRALQYAGEIGADVVNVSFKTGDRGIFEHPAVVQQRSLIVTSAGNGSEDLDGPTEGNLPASLRPDTELRRSERLIVVGAITSDPDHPGWESSAYSPTKVDLAAPGVNVQSLDHHGNRVCGYGTSVAAPLVTFVAAVVKALGLRRKEYVKERLALTAVIDDRLADRVKDGRELAPLSAVDLFVDQVRMNGVSGYRRGWIQTGPDPSSMLPVCGSTTGLTHYLARGRGMIDLPYLAAWRRSGDSGVVTHRMEDTARYWATTSETCSIPTGSLSFRDFADGEVHSIPWTDIEAIIPTPFRAVSNEVLVAAGLRSQ